MKNSIIFISDLSLTAMMLGSCENIPSSFNPFAPETATTSTSGPPVTSQTNRPTYEMPLGARMIIPLITNGLGRLAVRCYP